MKIILSVSKKDESIWKIYYFEHDSNENGMVFKSKSINRVLVPFYKMIKFHRNKVYCTECETRFTFFNRWFSGKPKCPYCD